MEEQHHDDQSHYEVSLTAGQAFTAFVLLLLSLAASFAFGLMIGKGQTDDRLVVKKETPVVTEASVLPKKSDGRIVELGVAEDDFQEPAATTETTAPPVTVQETETGAAQASGLPPAEGGPEARTAPESPLPHYAQLLSTMDQKTAEALAAKVIEGGFTTAYVERSTTDKGPVFRVRVKFSSETEARASEPKLREFSKDVWITAK